MQSYTLNVVNREKSGSGVSNRLRAEGMIPASLYGQGKARSITVKSTDFRDLNREIGGGAALVELKDDKGESALCLVQDIQFHPIKSRIDHIDFQEVERGHKFVTKIPTVLIGESDCVGVKDGGILDHKSLEVEIRCRPSKLPEHVEVQVADLKAGEAIHIRDLPELDEVEYLDNEAMVIVSVQEPTAAVETTDDESSQEVAADEVPAMKVSEGEEKED